MADAAVLRGKGALQIHSQSKQTVTADIQGTAKIQNVDVTDDLIVADQLHVHDVVSDVCDVPGGTRLLLTPADTGTLFRLAGDVVVVLPDVGNNTPLTFEFMGRDLASFCIACGPEAQGFAPTSFVMEHNGHLSSEPSFLSPDMARNFKRFSVEDCPYGIRCLRIKVQTVASRDGPYRYRLTGDIWAADE
jgi:hypothetical protein